MDFPSEDRRSRLLLFSFSAVLILCLSLIVWWITYFLNSSEIIRELQIKVMDLQGNAGDLSMVESRYSSHTLMVLSEGVVLLGLLIFLSTLIYRGFLKEREFAGKQRQLISRVSHEFNTPIASLRLYLETLERAEWSEEKKQRFLETMKEDLDRLQGLVRQVLDFSRSTAVQEVFPSEPVVLSDFFEHYLSSVDLRMLGLPSPIPLKEMIQLDPVKGDPSLVVSASSKGLCLVLDNLISNALKYGEGKPMKISWAAQGKWASVEIRDEGRGFEPEQGEALFQPFYRGEDSHSPGTGLGLATVRSLVEGWHGKVTAESLGPGRGSAFRIQLRKTT